MNFKELLTNINFTDAHFKSRTSKSIDKLMTIRNWMIGGYILVYEQKGEDRAAYGSKLEEKLADTMNQKGLSARNLKLFKQFYLTYPQLMQTVSALFEDKGEETMQTLSASSIKFLTEEAKPSVQKHAEIGSAGELLIENLSFSHFVELLKVDDPLKRSYYELECIKGIWSVRELKRQINVLAFERSSVAHEPEKMKIKFQQNSEKLLPAHLLKTPYVFDFLGLSDETLGSELEVERALINDLKTFMLELGHGFCFEAQQKRIIIGGEYFFVDLVFYHRILKCHVIVELKIDAFNHAHAGQLNTYIQYYKQKVQEKEDNPPIGILLCTTKNEELVEFALGGMDENLFVSQYKTALPSKDQLQQFLKTEKDKLE